MESTNSSSINAAIQPKRSSDKSWKEKKEKSSKKSNSSIDDGDAEVIVKPEYAKKLMDERVERFKPWYSKGITMVIFFQY